MGKKWVIHSRPGQTGFNRIEIERKWDSEFGKGNWKKAHTYNETLITKFEAFKICEEAYYIHSLRNESQWLELLQEASDVYDLQEDEIVSGTDYSKQNPNYTRFHDICIRNVLKRRNWSFSGSKLVQIRFEEGKSKKSDRFDPGKIIFHEPEKIKKPNLKGWWDVNSIEDFYQSNKVLLVRKN